MKKSIAAVLLLAGLGAGFAGGWSIQKTTLPNRGDAARKPLYYVDPMHPAYKSDKPGIAPDCGMELVPVYEDGGMGAAAQGAAMLPGAVALTSEKQQLIGVTTAVVARSAGQRTLRVLGRVALDETRIFRINTATDGWVKKVLPVTTDSLVEKDQLLAAFYAPEFLSATKAYLYALRAMDRFAASNAEAKAQSEVTEANIENYRNSLRNLGMTDYQLDEMRRTRKGGEDIEIRAPAAGFVVTRNLSLGQRFEKGTEVYRIADLSKVWIVLETLASDVATISPGMAVRVYSPHLRESFTARVAHVPPRFDPATQTQRIRLEADNPGLHLRPDMFVDVELPVGGPGALAVPAGAVLDAGIRQTVFVDRGEGIFEPREVKTGWRARGQVEIVEGLAPGERIATSGTFLLDSESRLKNAAAGTSSGEGHSHAAIAPTDGAVRPIVMAKDPVCGMDVDARKAEQSGLAVAVEGKRYYFCSLDCKGKFTERRRGHAAAPGAPSYP